MLPRRVDPKTDEFVPEDYVAVRYKGGQEDRAWFIGIGAAVLVGVLAVYGALWMFHHRGSAVTRLAALFER